MNRRTFLRTGTLAVVSTGAVAGCLGSGSGQNVPVTVNTTDGFDELATYDSEQVDAESSEDGQQQTIVTYLVEPQTDECVDVSAHVRLYDDDEVVIDEGEYREQYDPGESYRAEHSFSYSPSEVSEVSVTLSTNQLSAMCYL